MATITNGPTQEEIEALAAFTALYDKRKKVEEERAKQLASIASAMSAFAVELSPTPTTPPAGTTPTTETANSTASNTPSTVQPKSGLARFGVWLSGK